MKNKLMSVDSILSTFRETIAKLDACAKGHEGHAGACTAQAEALAQASEASKTEAARAKIVKQKLEELIGE